MAGTTPQHFAPTYPNRESARAIARKVNLTRRINSAPQYCQTCSAWHLSVLTGNGIDDTDRVVLNKVALGLRAHEIASDIQESESQVTNRVKALMLHFGALSRANLAILAVAFNLVDPAIALRDERQVDH